MKTLTNQSTFTQRIKNYTKPFFDVRNSKKGSVAKGSLLGYTIRAFIGFVEFFIPFSEI